MRRAAAWMVAIRPRTLPAAVAPVLAGTAIAHWRSASDPVPAVAALAGALLLQIGANLANDYFDFRKGADGEERIGPVRVVQAGLLPAEAVLRATGLVLGLAFLVGIYLVYVGGWPILAVGLAGLLCAVAYTGGPFPLAYRGLGDVFAFLFFGPVAVAGTYWVQARELTADVLLAGVGVGALVAAILVVNNLRDREQDERAGKRTLAVRIGDGASRIQYVLLVVGALAVPVLGVRLLVWPEAALFGLGSVVFLVRPLITVWAFRDRRELNGALVWTGRGVAWYAGLMALGFLAG